MQQRRTFCIGWTVFAAGACAQTPSPASDVQAARWRALRSQRGHFHGAAWNDAVDRWQGEKHRLMQALAQRAREQRLDRAGLLALMGAPDAQWPSAAAAPPGALDGAAWQPQAPGPDALLLVYNWRAEHDRLLFALQAHRVVATAWLLAYER